MNKAIVIDIDGVLSDSWEDQKECFCGDNQKGLEEYLRRIPKLPVAEWVLDLMSYYSHNYKIIILTARPVRCKEATLEWLKKHVANYDMLKIIFKANEDTDDSIFKLNQIKDLSKKYQIDFILEDNPKTVKLLHKNNFRALLTPGLYEWGAKF